MSYWGPYCFSWIRKSVQQTFWSIMHELYIYLRILQSVSYSQLRLNLRKSFNTKCNNRMFSLHWKNWIVFGSNYLGSFQIRSCVFQVRAKYLIGNWCRSITVGLGFNQTLRYYSTTASLKALICLAKCSCKITLKRKKCIQDMELAYYVDSFTIWFW